MKTTSYQHTEESSVKYIKGRLYINMHRVIVLCTDDSTCILRGIIVHYEDKIHKIGESVHISTSECEYTEFHGTVTLEN